MAFTKTEVWFMVISFMGQTNDSVFFFLLWKRKTSIMAEFKLEMEFFM